MVGQAQMKSPNGHGTNGGHVDELPPRAVARSTAELLHDMASLAELQGKLVVVDLREGVAKMLVPLGLAVAGICVALGTIPVGLMTLAFALEKLTTLSVPVCFAIAFGVGLLLAAILIIPALATLKTGVQILDRSLAELRRNLQWVKETIKRMGQGGGQASRYSHRL
jgi:hypothetical protein